MKRKLTIGLCILFPSFLLIVLAAGIVRLSTPSAEAEPFPGLEAVCRELEASYNGFGVLITDPGSGTIEFTYNDKMVFAERYCPGSLLKPFVMLSRARSDELESGQVFDCLGYEDPVWPCWLGEGHGELDLKEALAHSCNSYFYKYALRGLSRHDYVQVLKDYDLKLFGSEFTMSDDEFYSTAFGLGIYYNIHPARMLYGYNALFNGGALYNTRGELVHTIQEQPEAIECIRQGMMESYLYGTSKLIFEKSAIPDVITKTGTGAVTTDSGSFDWRKNIGWVVVMYPSYKPRFSMLVVMEKSKSSIACLVAAAILKHLDENNLLSGTDR